MSSLPDHLHALLYPRAYPHPVRAVDLIETHISWVLLTGKFAYKIKRPVHHSFIDLRRAAQRRRLCHEEVRLNRRFAPELYLGVRAIRWRQGEARIGGPGRIIEHAVSMRQFPRTHELDALLAARHIGPAELETFGAASLEAWTAAALPLLERRFAAGRVRECHGDLHAANIVRCGARLLPFDCLEFDPALRWIDVADEVSFLLADLDARDRPLHAQAFLGGYLSASGDYQACLLAPVFRAHRALVRAKIMALTALASGAARLAKRTARQWHEKYLACARRALAPQRPGLVLMCGLSGSGKTWLARRLAPALGAVHLRSDIERKRLAGLAPLARSASAVARGLYGREVTGAVYARLAECATDALAGGYTTIVDATFAAAADRARFRAVAAQLGLDLRIVYCHAPRRVLESRIRQRGHRADDPSEADLEVLHWQERHFTPPGAHEANAILDAAQIAPAELVRRIRVSR